MGRLTVTRGASRMIEQPVDGRYSIVRYSSLALSTSHAERCLALLDPGGT
jgi:hypothetical protein